ncbi:uncharacterized protein TNCT_659901 [Trichonephila clavata]|uniref:Uncharacterized protein n=1 Tax=Trichonephila clavata TaxID=2740835 RepID=A0A8X6L5T6_TRICU|nr:uncharacterized protein TNCT_659901 [Trichonephila clavata]
MSSIKTLNRKMGNILAQLTKLSSKPLDNLSEFELRTTLDLLYDIKEKFEDIKQAYFEIDNDKEFKDVEPILNKIDEDIQDFQMPIIKDKVQLGSSKDLMVKGLNSTLIRLNRSPDVKKLYNEFYVDDVLSCAPDLETDIEIQPQLIGMMNAGGMHLYKWCSNSRHLLSKVSTDDQEYVVGNDDLIRNNIWGSGPDLLHSDVDFTNNWDCSNTDPLYMKELKPIMNTFVQSTLFILFLLRPKFMKEMSNRRELLEKLRSISEECSDIESDVTNSELTSEDEVDYT